MNSNNGLKTALLLAALTALLILVGRVLAGSGGMVIAFGLALVMNFVAYWFSDKIALAQSGAKEVTYEEAPDLYRIVERVATEARLPMPKLYIVQNPSPNAFATGRDPDHAAVAVTTGIVRILSREELSAVLAHEIAHVRNRDTLIATVAATIAGAITMVANMAQWAFMFGGLGGRSSDDEGGGGIGSLVGGLVMIIVAPLAAMVIQLAISRSREFGADATGARIIGNPLALASALEKLDAAVHVRPMAVSPSIAPLFIVNPITGQMLAGLFSTHPPIAERVARLQQMAYRV